MTRPTTSTATGLLLRPDTYDPSDFDSDTRRLLRATVEWFEARGKRRLTDDYHAGVFYADFLEFVAREKLFATFLTPAEQADGDPHKRWDTGRIAALSEVLGFYGLNYWYPWQVTVLGLGPVWQSANGEAKRRAARALEDGAVAAFGLSEQAHGADIYSTDMLLSPDGAGGWRATGGKYYIGNGNCARIVSVFGRLDGVEGADQYVFFYADCEHPAFHVVRNVVPGQMYVAEFRLEDYPVAPEDLLHTGADAFSAALNTVNIGKFNLCFGGIGIATHAFYEAITHAHNRVLYGASVTSMPHIRRDFVDAYARLLGMRLFSDRAVDYFRSATAEDRRYLLYNPVTKMQVTTEAQRVVTLLSDIVSAKGFERDSIVAIAKRDVDGLPKLEGTVAVNLALILKFMPAYLGEPRPRPEVPTRRDAADDEFLFRQGSARGLSQVRFDDWRRAYERFERLPNVARFAEQADALREHIAAAPPADAPLDLQLVVGRLFTLVVYGQLILEQATLIDVDDDVVDELFGVLIGDFSSAAIDLHGNPGTGDRQQEWALGAIRRPVADAERFDRVWQRVAALAGAYEMNA